jgi:hypothetical protein
MVGTGRPVQPLVLTGAEGAHTASQRPLRPARNTAFSTRMGTVQAQQDLSPLCHLDVQSHAALVAVQVRQWMSSVQGGRGRPDFGIAAEAIQLPV